jgi:hypothetical protein
MFWACIVGGDKRHSLKDSARPGSKLHISAVVLHAASAKSPVTVFIEKPGTKIPIAQLEALRPMAKLDLYFGRADEFTLAAEGKGEVSILGNFEPTEEEVVIEAEDKSKKSGKSREEKGEEEEKYGVMGSLMRERGKKVRWGKERGHKVIRKGESEGKTNRKWRKQEKNVKKAGKGKHK